MRVQLRARLVRALAVLVAAAALAVGRVAAQQTGSITGLVRAAETGQPLASVQVYIAGRDLGALSQANGRFLILNVPAGTHTVTAERIGYRAVTAQVTVAGGGTVIQNFDLSETALALDEIVVTGTAGGTQVRAIGNVVERMDVAARSEVAPITNMNQLMSQQTPGTYSLGLSANVGTGSVVRIRGMSSMALGSNPLLYVDGVRVDNSFDTGPSLRGGQQASRLNDFNPDDIESIEIIKGPAAATLYGTEAANGVIQIITKRGASGAPSLDVSIRQGTSWISNPAERLFTTYWYKCPQNLPANQNCNTAQILADQGVLDSMNIYEEYEERTGQAHFDYGRIQNYDASVRGGTDLLRYFVSAGYDDEVGVVDYNWQEKFSTRANVSVTPSERWDLNVSLGYIDSETRFAQAATGLDLWSLIVWTDPRTRTGPTEGHRYATPEAIANVDARQAINRFTGSFQITHRPLSWLSHRATVGLDYTSERTSQLFPRVPDGEFNFFGARGVGEKTIVTGATQFTSFDYGATASFDLTPTITSNTSAGIQYNARSRTTNTSYGLNFPSTVITSVGGAATTTASESWLENKTLGTYVQQEFGWRDRVFVTGAVRGDDNSAFGGNFDAAIYPKFSATWVMSEESFFEVDWVDQLRVRTAWGRAGMQPGTFDAVTLYSPATGAGNLGTVTPRTLGNEDIKPEVGEELELGFDVSLFEERVSLSYTRYDKKTKDALIGVPVPPSTGFPGTQMQNLGLVKAWGNEISLNGSAIRGERFGLDLGLSFSTQKNRIEDMGSYEPVTSFGTRNIPGYPINGRFVTHITSAEFLPGTRTPTNVMCDGGLPNPDYSGPDAAQYAFNRGGDPVPCTANTIVFLGTADPTWSGAFTTGLRFGSSLRLNTVTEFAGGHFASTMYSGASRSMNSTLMVNPISDPRMAAYLQTYDSRYHGDHDAGFARLREVSLSYDLPQGLVERSGASRASLTLGARNLAFLWRAQEYQWDGEGCCGTPGEARAPIFDPEMVGAGDNQTVSQVVQLPPAANFITTLRVTF